MARIRSIHPGLFTDEAFASASPYARLLLIGIWTEAWDDGVFDWKPLSLKMRIFPADSCDVPALLDELASLGIIRKVEANGKPYGLVRNFCKFQKPKKPNDSGVFNDSFREFVAFNYHKDRTTPEPVRNQFVTGSEKPILMEDGGGKGEDAFSNEKATRASDREADFRQQIGKCFASVNRLPPDTGRAVVWLANGWKPEVCIAVTRDVLSRKANASLAYIEPAIRQAHETPAPATGPPRKAAQKSYLTLAAEANGNSHERDYDPSIIDASNVAAEGGGWPDANAGGFGTGRTDSDHPGFAGPIARTAGVFR